MGVTTQKASVVADKFIADKVQRRRHVPAAVHVGVKTSTVVDQKCIQAIFLADQPEFFYRPRRQVVHLCDHPSAAPAFVSHPAPIAPKEPALNRQANEIERQKNQRKINRQSHGQIERGYSESLSTSSRIRFTSLAVWRPEMPMTFISSVVISAVT